MKKIICLNIILIIFILIAFDATIFFIDTKRYHNFKSFKAFFEYYKNYNFRQTNEKYLYNKYILGFDKDLKYRRVVNYNSKLEPILLFGGSFSYGYNIREEFVSSEFFGKHTNRPIYNRSYHGIGPQLMLFHLENDKFYEQIVEPKYIIYTFHKADLNRVITPSICSIKNYIELNYKYEKEELKRESENKIFKQPFTICNIKNNLNKNKQEINLLKKYILKSKEFSKKHWKNTKFILFIYTEADYSILSEIEKELEENEIIIIKRKDIAPFDDFDTKYALSETDDHPNEYAWDYIVPKLMERIEKTNTSSNN